MQEFSGKLVKDGEAAFEGVKGRMDVETKSDGRKVWTGFLNLPSGSPVAVNDAFELALDDGRSSKIKVERVNSTAQFTAVSFASEP